MKKNFNARQALETAVGFLNGGRVDMAAGLCREILDLDPKNANASYLLGVISHRTGQQQDAIDLITQSLKHEPKNAEAQNYLGAVLVDAGRRQEAEKCFRRAIRWKPGFPEAHNNLGNVLLELDRFDEAVPNFRKALAMRPDYAEAHHSLGCCFIKMGRLEDAVDSIKKAIAGNHNHYEAHNNLGDVLCDLGRHAEAVESYRKAIDINPDFTEAHNKLGLTLIKIDQLDDAASSFRKAISINPDLAELYNNLGNTLLESGQMEDAIANLRKAIKIKPDFAKAYDNLGFALLETGHLNNAISSFRKAIDIKPDFAEPHNNLGFAFMETGQLDDAVTNFRKAIDIKPDFTAAYRNLAHVKKHTSCDSSHIKKMEEIFSSPDADDDQKKHLAFALGKSFEDLRQYEKAFEFFIAGNALTRNAFHYDNEEWSAYVKMLKVVFDDKFFARPQGIGCADETPIFILGMPRSGTTLVEQILASHPSVYGAGELDAMSSTLAASLDMKTFPNDIQDMGSDILDHLGGEYIHAIRRKSKKARFITDKMPGNFKYIGMIKRILPNAKIIHCMRSPQDNCLSLFKNYFPQGDNKYAYDMNELGQYYKIYRELMGHWDSVLPGFVYDIQYEELVADQEEQTRALLAHCNLEWDDACLQFHKSDRLVKTLSTAQVRQPIYKDSVQLWKRYERQLAPLIEALR